MIRYNFSHIRLDLCSVFLGTQRHDTDAIIHSHWFYKKNHFLINIVCGRSRDNFLTLILCISLFLHLNKLQFLPYRCTLQKKFWLVVYFLHSREQQGLPRLRPCLISIKSTTPISLGTEPDLVGRWIIIIYWRPLYWRQYNLQRHTVAQSFITVLCTSAVPQTDSRVCVPVPMFHTFGTVISGVLMGVHGVSLVFPSTAYNETANLAALERERY